MRTTLDLPDALMRHLKARAALEGRSLRDLNVWLALVVQEHRSTRTMPLPAVTEALSAGPVPDSVGVSAA
ncbi:MAG: hypothetical protein U1F00_08120 [Rhodoferax sp.]